VADDTTSTATTDGTEAETFTTDEQGVAYTSESSPAADPARPATIAPAAACNGPFARLAFDPSSTLQGPV
jgi:hypothetical protein